MHHIIFDYLTIEQSIQFLNQYSELPCSVENLAHLIEQEKISVLYKFDGLLGNEKGDLIKPHGGFIKPINTNKINVFEDVKNLILSKEKEIQLTATKINDEIYEFYCANSDWTYKDILTILPATKRKLESIGLTAKPITIKFNDLRVSSSSILEYLETFKEEKEEVTTDGVYIVIGALLDELHSRIPNCTQEKVMQLLQERSLPEAPLSKSKLTKIFAPANKKYADFRK
ncbi:hypothetical protein [Acinetobacter radioresistens]|uniref:hypothetical protein n=1 Tax=Acinetobacter radioresistens TaxID=40216 RepID=UPI00061956D3|nr:hypothetical protein [Acinetobacter radioresistens]